MRKILGKITPTFAAIMAALIVGGGSSAFAAGLIHNHDIANNAVTSNKIADGTIRISDLRAGAVHALQGNKALPGAPGKDNVLGTDTLNLPATVVDHIGGRWALGRTNVVHGIMMRAGTYLMTINADFIKTAGVGDGASPVLQIQVNSDTNPGTSAIHTFLTAYTGAFPSSPNEALNRVEQNASVTALVTLPVDMPIEVDAFGYNADQSAAGSGDFTVTPTLSWVKINTEE